MNIPTKLRIFTCFFLTATYSFTTGTAGVKQHAHQVTGALTGLSAAKFLHTSVTSFRQGKGLPRSKGYVLNGLAIALGAWATHYLHTNAKKTKASPTPSPEAPSLFVQLSALPLLAEQPAAAALQTVDVKVATQKLVDAIRKGNLELARTALAQGANAHKPVTSENQSPLYMAAQFNRAPLVKLLLELPGMDVNASDDYKNTALHVAAHYGHLDIIKLLLEKQNITVTALNVRGATPLYNAKRALEATSNLAKKEQFTACIKLLEAHQNIDAATLAKITLLEEAAAFLRAAATNDLVTVQHFMEKYATTGDMFGNTALHVAAQQGHVNMVTALLANNRIDLNRVNVHGETALMLAFQNKHHAVLKLLLDDQRQKNDPAMLQAAFDALQNNNLELLQILPLNIIDAQGNTLLHKAVELGNIDTIRMLLQRRPEDLTATNAQGESPLALANRMRGTLGAEVILVRQYDILGLLLAHERRGDEGRDMIFNAAVHGDLEILRRLPAQLLDTIRLDGRPLLHTIIYNHYVACAEFFLNNNPNIYAKNPGNYTVLHQAMARHHQAGHTEDAYRIIEMLLARDAQIRQNNAEQIPLINMQDNTGETALHALLKIRGYSRDIAILLIQHGADPELPDNDGRTAWQNLTPAQRAPLEKALAAYRGEAGPQVILGLQADATDIGAFDAEVLGLTEQQLNDDGMVRAAYKRLRIIWHPDRLATNATAQARYAQDDVKRLAQNKKIVLAGQVFQLIENARDRRGGADWRPGGRADHLDDWKN